VKIEYESSNLQPMPLSTGVT